MDPILDVRRVAFADPTVQALVAEVQAEYVVRYGSVDETPMDPGGLDPPRGAFLLGTQRGRPVAMGGWRWRPDVSVPGGGKAAEIKRMYVAAAARRSGLARLLLARLEESARDAGAEVMILETGLKQPEAVALYRSSGYTDTVRFGYYAESPHAVYLAKPLTSSPR